MQDYAKQLLSAINQYDADNPESVNHLRDLVCWISDNDALKKDKMLAQLLYIASQKMRVFGYNMLNGYSEDPNEALATLEDISNQAIKNLYRSRVNEKNTLDKSQMEVVDLFQSLSPRRLLVSAPTSYGKTFLMREIVFLNKDRYNNILLVFPTVALLLENARMMSAFVFDNNLDYQIIKTVDSVVEDESKKIFVFTPERALQLIASFPDLKIDFFFFDEVYKIDEDYCNDELDDSDDEKSKKNKKTNSNPHDFLNEDRGKTFRITLYLLAKSVDEFYLAGPNLNQDRFSKGMKRFLSLNQIVVKEINFEPTLRISVNAHSSKIEEVTPCFLPKSESNELVPIEKKVNDRIKNVVTYISDKHYGKTLLYCTTPAKAIEYSNKLSDNMGALRAFDAYPDDFKTFLSHIQKEYDIDHSVDEWSLIKVLQNGFGMHHGKLPKYIQQEILDQFNKGTFDVLFCTSTIVEGVNTDAQNMIILNASKGSKKLTPFDIKNIKGRAGRYYVCSAMINARFALLDYEKKPQALQQGAPYDCNIYKKFHKMSIIFSNYLGRKAQIIIKGNSYRCIRAYPSFEMIPLLIVDNAVKYSYESKNITVEFHEYGKQLVVDIDSFSPYCSMDDLSKICNKGYRGKNAVRVSDGSGIGLFFAKMLCDLHGIEMIPTSDSDKITEINGVPYAPFRMRLVFPNTYEV